MKPLAEVVAIDAARSLAEIAARGGGWVTFVCAAPPEGCGETSEILASAARGRLCWSCEQRRLRAASAAADRRWAVAERAEFLEGTGAPPRFRRGFTEPRCWPRDPTHPGSDVSSWGGDPWSLTLLGVSAAGKTFLATELLWRVGRERGGGRWATATEVIRRLYGGAREGEDPWTEYARTPVLLIDDLGGGHTGQSWEALFDVLSERHAHERPTIVTSSRKVGDLAREQSALWRRLREGLLVGYLQEPWKGGG